MTQDTDFTLANSVGQHLTNEKQLDGHFAACKPEYESMLSSIGLQQGWHVLDAGCGVGSFLPLMSRILGSTGQIKAVDLAPENVELVANRGRSGIFECSVNASVEDVTKMSFESNLFDAIWCANVTQYLDDNECSLMLQEFRRILKPNGLLGIKEHSIMCWQYHPLEPLLMARLWDALLSDDNQHAKQAFRVDSLPAWTKRAGFKVLKSNTIMSERWQPLKATEIAYYRGLLTFLASLAENSKQLSDEDRKSWKKIAEVNAHDYILHNPDFYAREGNLVIVAEALKE